MERFRQTGRRKMKFHEHLGNSYLRIFRKPLLQVMRVPESYPASLCRLQLARRFISRVLILFGLENRRKVKIGSSFRTISLLAREVSSFSNNIYKVSALAVMLCNTKNNLKYCILIEYTIYCYFLFVFSNAKDLLLKN